MPHFGVNSGCQKQVCMPTQAFGDCTKSRETRPEIVLHFSSLSKMRHALLEGYSHPDVSQELLPAIATVHSTLRTGQHWIWGMEFPSTRDFMTSDEREV